MFSRHHLSILKQRLTEKRRFIQVLLGPRQVGKTTLIRQLIENWPGLIHYVSADEAAHKTWIEQQWESARIKLRATGAREAVLVIDEIQKISDWSSSIKTEWDKDTFNKINIKLVLLGSSQLLLQKGLSESLAGRFEILFMPHWTFSEMREAFDFTPEPFVWFGGYPGAADLIHDEMRWKEYIRHSMIETSIMKDILLLTRIDKPSLLKRLFEIACSYSGQIVSYTKILGLLQDAGNTTTLAHYLDLLDGAGMVSGLQKYAVQKVRQRGSIPKFQVHNTAFMSALSPDNFSGTLERPDKWGRWIESAVGAHLSAATRTSDVQLFYWRERLQEVDFVLFRNQTCIAIEVKTTGKWAKGMDAFADQFFPKKKILVGGSGIPLEEFLLIDIHDLFL